MLPLFLAVALAEAPADAHSRASAAQPARAVVRIVRGAAFRLDRLKATDESVLRASSVRDSDGSLRPASLVEFY